VNLGQKEVKKLLANALRNAEKDRLRQTAEELHQARQIAKKTGNEPLAKQVQNQANQIFGKFRYTTKTQSNRLEPLKTNGFILDIGGGGEGIIGKLNGTQVIAIDTSEEESQETRNEALKVVLDATDSKFLPQVFQRLHSFLLFHVYS